MRVKAVPLRSDGRSTEARVWQEWLNEAARLAARFSQELDGDDPFAYNEAASVSLLTAAAVQAGMLALAEFAGKKSAAHDRRRRAHGRHDFWMLSDELGWAIEFKQLFSPVTPLRLRSRMDQAHECARRIQPAECDRAVAGLIVSLYYHDARTLPRAREAAEAFARECQFAWRIGDSAAGSPETYLFFDTVRKHG